MRGPRICVNCVTRHPRTDVNWFTRDGSGGRGIPPCSGMPGPQAMLFHISMSRSAVQMRGFLMPEASS